MSRDTIGTWGDRGACRRGDRDALGRPVRVSLVAWPVVLFLGATIAGAACLFGECPCRAWAQARQTLVGHAGTVRSLAIAPDGALMASVGDEGSIVLWDLATRQRYSLPGVGFDPVRYVALSPDSQVLAAGSRTAPVALHDLGARQSRALDDGPAATVDAACLAFAPDGAALAVGQPDGRITFWDVADGRGRSALAGHAGFVAAMAFAPDGRVLASSGGDRAVRLWDLATGQLRLEIRGRSSTFVPLTFAPDGRLLALADQVSPVVRLWDVAGGCERAVLRGPAGSVLALAISPDGTTLAAADLQGQVSFWDLATLQLQPSRRQHAGVRSLAFAPDGRLLATGGFDGTIHLWDWPVSRPD